MPSDKKLRKNFVKNFYLSKKRRECELKIWNIHWDGTKQDVDKLTPLKGIKDKRPRREQHKVNNSRQIQSEQCES